MHVLSLSSREQKDFRSRTFQCQRSFCAVTFACRERIDRQQVPILLVCAMSGSKLG